MDVLFYFVFALGYLSFAGYGVTGFLSRHGSQSHFFVFLNGYCLSIVVFSESCAHLFSPTHAFWASFTVSLVVNCLYIYYTRRARKQSSWSWKTASDHGARVFRAYLAVYLLAIVAVAFFLSSFAISGWHGFWGTANEDIFDGLNGRDAFVAGGGTQMLRFLDPFTSYQYTSLSFWSFLFRSFDGMNVFYLQGILMILLQITGIYFLCREGFRFSHKLSLFCTLLGVGSAFYISTFYTGHEGSVIFGGMIPYVLGLSLKSLRERRLAAGDLVFLLLWLYVIVHTYVFPLGFTLIPFTLYCLYLLVFTTPKFKMALKSAFQHSIHVSFLQKPLQFKWIALGAVALVLIVGGYFLLKEAWSVLEPIRIRAATRYRAWAISQCKEMALIYWGILPANIPYGSVGNIAANAASAFVSLGFFAAFVYTVLVVYGAIKLWTDKHGRAAFLSVFAVCWLFFFLVMKYMVLDSYYLYKFFYTNYFLGAIILGFSFDQLLRHARSLAWPVWERTKRAFVLTVVFLLVGTNVTYVVLYNIDLLSRPYNSDSADFTDVDGLMPYVSAGIFFHLPRYDYQDLVQYILTKRGVPRPELVLSNYTYELYVKGIRDVLPLDRRGEVIWENGVYRLVRAPEKDRLITYSYYQAEQHPAVCNGHPFRWVNDAISLDVINPSGTNQSLLACVEPGPGLDYRPFQLYVYVNNTLFDSIYVNGMQAAVLALPKLDQYINTIKVLNKDHGKNLLPWDERYLNYRVSLLGLTDQRFPIEALRILNTRNDIVPHETWSRLTTASETFRDTTDLLCIWNGWGSMEQWGGARFRWVNNDAELLLFNPSEKSRFLNVELERGPSLPPGGDTLVTYVNGTPCDSLAITAFRRVKINLPDVLQNENLIRFHVSQGAGQRASADDPRILNFRVFRISLSEN
jgi:hypothetical protein